MACFIFTHSGMRLGFWLWNVTTFLMGNRCKALLILTAFAPFKCAFLFHSSSLTFIPVHRSFGHFAKTNMAACLGSSVIRWDWPSPERLSRERACQVSHQAGTNRVDIAIPWGRTAAPDWQPSFARLWFGTLNQHDSFLLAFCLPVILRWKSSR